MLTDNLFVKLIPLISATNILSERLFLHLRKPLTLGIHAIAHSFPRVGTLLIRCKLASKLPGPSRVRDPSNTHLSLHPQSPPAAHNKHPCSQEEPHPWRGSCLTFPLGRSQKRRGAALVVVDRPRSGRPKHRGLEAREQ